ncbi:MAG TPA: hypothetical protein VFG03_05050 [Telluria sp.]|nr:hypothetical protein [Telluria sp.]
MTSQHKIVNGPQYFNVDVHCTWDPQTDTYITKTFPDPITITEPNTIINYQIIQGPGQKLVFIGMSKLPDHQHQFSVPSISVDRTMITFSDANTKKVTFNVDLYVADADGNLFSHDPQVLNEPGK